MTDRPEPTAGRARDLEPVRTPVGSWAVAAGLMALQALGVAAFGIWSGLDGNSARSWSFAVTLLVLAGGVAALARALAHRRSAGRTPTMLWNALLLPIGFSVGDAGAPWAGWMVVGLAAATFVATVLSRGGRAGQDSAEEIG